MGHIISVINNKGGCGKSTTTFNLADALGKKGKRVLVIDMDPQCNTTSILLSPGRSIDSSLYEIIDPLSPPQDIDGFIYPTGNKNMFLIPNIPETGAMEYKMVSSAPDSFSKPREMIRDYALKNFYTTIIDNPPNMGAFVKSSLYISDFVIIPIKAGSAFSVEGLIKATHLIAEVRNNGNPHVRFLRLLINSLDRRTTIGKAFRDLILQAFDKRQIFETEIPMNSTFEKAESMRETIFQCDGTSAGARAFLNLAGEFISIMEQSYGK